MVDELRRNLPGIAGLSFQNISAEEEAVRAN